MLFSSVFLTSLAFVSASDHNGFARRHNSLNRRQSSLTGDSTCGNSMCVQAVLNGTSIEYTLSKKAGTSGTPGWMGVGFGARMGGSEMVIMWANSDGTITLSQRKATGYVEPKVATPTKVATLSNSLSTTSGDVKFVFTMDAPTTKLDDYNIVFGYGSTNPGSSAADATLQQHLDYGFGEFDLTKAFTSTGTASGTAPSATSTGSSGSNSGSNSSDNDDRPLLPYQRAILAHGIICVIGFLFFLPAGALLARYLRTFSNSWFAGHWISQFAISGPIIIAGLALGVSGVSQAGAEHFDDEHKRWGVIIVILYFLQCIVGAAIHWVKPKRSTGRPPQNYFHAVLGLLIIALALYQVRSGYNDEWPKTTGRGVYRGVNIIWWIWVVLFPVLYLAGVALLPRQLRQEAASRGRSNKGLSQHDYAFNMEHINTQQHIQPQQYREPQHMQPQYMQPQQRKYYD